MRRGGKKFFLDSFCLCQFFLQRTSPILRIEGFNARGEKNKYQLSGEGGIEVH